MKKWREMLGTGVVITSVGVGLHDGFATGLIILGVACSAIALFALFARWVDTLKCNFDDDA